MAVTRNIATFRAAPNLLQSSQVASKGSPEAADGNYSRHFRVSVPTGCCGLCQSTPRQPRILSLVLVRSLPFVDSDVRINYLKVRAPKG